MVECVTLRPHATRVLDLRLPAPKLLLMTLLLPSPTIVRSPHSARPRRDQLNIPILESPIMRNADSENTGKIGKLGRRPRLGSYVESLKACGSKEGSLRSASAAKRRVYRAETR